MSLVLRGRTRIKYNQDNTGIVIIFTLRCLMTWREEHLWVTSTMPWFQLGEINQSINNYSRLRKLICSVSWVATFALQPGKVISAVYKGFGLLNLRWLKTRVREENKSKCSARSQCTGKMNQGKRAQFR
jgi:hypothetical protein